jgi:c-di-AMP phosphodiesterase-like protein
MHKFLINRWHGLHIFWGFILLLVLVITLFLYEWILGVFALMLCGGLAYYSWLAEKHFRRDLNNYIMTLSHRVKRASHEVIHELPIGVLLYNEDKKVEWHNPFVSKMLGKESIIGEGVTDNFPLLKNHKDKESEIDIRVGKQHYKVIVKADERLLYFIDITDYTHLYKRYEDEKIAIGIVMMDNLDETTQGMEDQARSVVMARVVGEITDWANKNHLYMRRIASDKFLIMMDQKAVKSLEQSRFEILDDVRDLIPEQKIPFTLSIGIASGTDSLIELGTQAQASLDIALGRGGDQVAVKIGQRLTFHGGRTSAVEKRTRVRARVISHALRDLIKESDKVIIMGHQLPDMDSVGAAIGMLKAAHLCNKDGYIVLEGINPAIHRLMQEVKEHEELHKWFITPEQAMQITNPRSLAVVVDTHKASFVAEPKILQQTHRVVVVDHHRRGEEFINEAILVYMEPYASSACELITELLQYINEKVSLEVVEATMLLAGIVVDTKNFSFRTGARTFEAASFLRRNGADTSLVQRMLKEDLAEYMRKTEILKHAEIIHEHIAIAVTEPGQKFEQLLIAQVADTLLNMTGVKASFVICERPDGLIGVSARSLGAMNVQVVMEKLGGGGHLTNAASQLEGELAEVKERLLHILEEIENEEGLLE